MNGKTMFRLWMSLAFVMISCSIAQAAQYDLKQMTPEVKQAIADRQARFESIESLKPSGTLGEDNRGYVKVLISSGDTPRLAAAENADRRTIYEAIANQNNLGSSGLGIIETVFAEVKRNKAKPGEKIQLPSGEWVSK